MAVYFFDSSAVVKRYVQETGSQWITSLVEPTAGNSCWLAAITSVELLAVVHKKVRTGHISLAEATQADQVIRAELTTHYQVLPVTDKIISEAMGLLAQHPLRAYDAVQLATVLGLQSQRTSFGGLAAVAFISGDYILNQAALAEGFTVDDPNQHP